MFFGCIGHNLFSAIFFLLLAFPTYGQFISIEQRSEPAGFVNQSEVYEVGDIFQTIIPPLSESGYAFGYWSVSGARLQDSVGKSLVVAQLIPEQSVTLIAHYFEINEDSDADGLADWYEYRNFGDLNQSASLDYDEDGFSNETELALGQESTVVDAISDGGISSRDSSSFVFGRSELPKFEVYSAPIGFHQKITGYQELNSTYITEILNGSKYGYSFGYWSVNGLRQTGLTGVASGNAWVTMTQDMEIIAHYFDSAEDSDADGIMDWFEYNQFGDLTQGPSDDPDGDGFSNREEGVLGQEAMIVDTVADGGVSSRDSSTLVFGHTSLSGYVIASSPVGFVEVQQGFAEDGAMIETGDEYGVKFGYRFAYWSVNGVRQENPMGLSQSSVIRALSDGDELIAHYFEKDDDTDEDGLADWYEYNQFGDLSYSGTGDPDDDGYSIAREQMLGNDARIKDLVMDGGISSRDSSTISYFVQANRPPVGIDISEDHFFAFTEAGLHVGNLIAIDYDDPSNSGAYTFEFVSGEGDDENGNFTISGNSLSTTSEFLIGEYSVRLRVTDSEGEVFEGTLSLFAIEDPNSDDDGDGIGHETELNIGTDPEVYDTDGDGFSDGHEYFSGSNPLDANSLPNQAPESLILSNASVIENSPYGEEIGIFIGTDPDGDSLRYGINYSSTVTNVVVKDPGGNPVVLWENGEYRWHENLNAVTLWSAHFSSQDGELKTYTMRFEDGKNYGAMEILESIDFPQPYEAPFVVDEHGTIEVTEDNGMQYYKVLDYYPSLGLISAIETSSDPDLRDILVPDQIFFVDFQRAEDFIATITSEAEFDWSFSGHESHSQISELTQPYVHEQMVFELMNNLPVRLDEYGRLTVAESMDYELDNKYYPIVVDVTDPDGLSLQKLFVINLLNQIEDLDGDGIEDFYDEDADGDGFSNEEEIAVGTDPMNASSSLNRPPDSISLSSFQIFENQPVGTIVGEFIGNDPDGDFLLFSLDQNESFDHSNFEVSSDGKLKTRQVFDYEKVSRYSIMVRAEDYGGLSLARKFTIEVIDSSLPIVDTARPFLDIIGNVQVGGSVHYTGGHTRQFEVGVLISSKPIFGDNREGVQKIKLGSDSVEARFFHTLPVDKSWKRLFVRAYAQNGEGISYGLEESILNQLFQKHDRWSNATPLANAPGWWESPWFGNFYKSQSGWLLHLGLGWVYPSPGESYSLWLWKDNLGWIWTKDRLYPFIYSDESGHWMYFFGEHKKKRLLYDYGYEEWFDLDDSKVNESVGSR
jgi:hypothetical protein